MGTLVFFVSFVLVSVSDLFFCLVTEGGEGGERDGLG